jgi:3-oxoacyl-[acyl-carrier protein] reductase
MDLKMKDQLFVVCGATSGFGKAIADALIAEGAHIIAIARGVDKLQQLQSTNPSQVEIFAGNIAEPETSNALIKLLSDRPLHGILINAGGPPAKTVMETSLEDWDNAYHSLLRWKVNLTQLLVPRFIKAGYGRLLFIESSSVKQPLENLVLSNSLRLAAVGFVKTLSQEIAKTGVTLNIMAPGSHNTPAIERIYQKKSEQTGKPAGVVREQAAQQIPVGMLGEASDFASLALWLLSPASKYVTGQTITVDGGSVKSIFG